MSQRTTTREKLLTAALELFTEHGYDDTRTTAIAARAGVSEMTLFRHFATKASLIIDDPYDPLIGEAIRRRPAPEPPLQAAVCGIRDAWQQVPEPAAVAVRERLRIVAATPTLTAALTRGSESTVAAIAEALRLRGCSPADGRVVAAAVVAALNESLLAWAVTDEPDLGAALRRVFRLLGADDG